MAGIHETCSVCGAAFDVQFRYQMEDRGDGFSFYCSQRCHEASLVAGADRGSEEATCEACAKRFAPDLVSQVFYVAGKRRYACCLACRAQVLSEASGARLGDLAPAPREAPAAEPPVGLAAPASAAVTGLSSASRPSAARPKPAQAAGGAAAVPISLSPASGAKLGAGAAATPRCLAVFNHKGGTGKTTTAVSVAAGLALRGRRVLLVDTDAQGNVGVSLGATAERSLYHVLVMGLRVSDATKTVRPNLELLPSNETLAAAELYLAGRQNRDRVLCERLSAASSAFDYVILDCSPSLSLMNQNALVFADSVLVPVACDYLSLVGVRQVIKTVKNVNALLHHPVRIWGVLPTIYDARAKICREAVATLKEHFGDRCLPPIRAAMKVKEAPAQGQTIFEYAAGTNAAEDYDAVVEAIIEARERGASPSRGVERPEAAATA
jgi:chromosome partitioning protein